VKKGEQQACKDHRGLKAVKQCSAGLWHFRNGSGGGLRDRVGGLMIAPVRGNTAIDDRGFTCGGGR
jgi:hypothetical protein